MPMLVVFLQKQRLLHCNYFSIKIINNGREDRRLSESFLRKRLFSDMENLIRNNFMMLLKKEVQMLSE